MWWLNTYRVFLLTIWVLFGVVLLEALIIHVLIKKYKTQRYIVQVAKNHGIW